MGNALGLRVWLDIANLVLGYGVGVDCGAQAVLCGYNCHSCGRIVVVV